MAITNGYCTLEQLKAQIGDDSDVLDTTLLERAIEAASRNIDAFCGRRFWIDGAVQTRKYRPTEPDIAWVHDIATTTGLVVTTDSSADGTYATSWTIGTDFELEPLGAEFDGAAYAWWRIVVIGTQYRFPLSARIAPLRVTAKFGWSDVPTDVEEACLMRATALFKRKESPQGVAGFDGFGAVRVSKMDPDVTSLLQPYMRNSVGAI